VPMKESIEKVIYITDFNGTTIKEFQNYLETNLITSDIETLFSLIAFFKKYDIENTQVIEQIMSLVTCRNIDKMFEFWSQYCGTEDHVGLLQGLIDKWFEWIAFNICVDVLGQYTIKMDACDPIPEETEKKKEYMTKMVLTLREDREKLTGEKSFGSKTTDVKGIYEYLTGHGHINPIDNLATFGLSTVTEFLYIRVAKFDHVSFMEKYPEVAVYFVSKVIEMGTKDAKKEKMRPDVFMGLRMPRTRAAFHMFEKRNVDDVMY